MPRDTGQKRALHALNHDGMVFCNPRDREAAHRAEMEQIATYDLSAVTCRKCCLSLRRLQRDTDSIKPQFSQETPVPTTDEPDSAVEVSAKFRRIRDACSLVAKVREGDGLDPREEKRKLLDHRSRGKPDYSSQRLASQIFDALCLSTWLTNIGLPEFTFVRIMPAASRGKYLVDIACLDLDLEYDPHAVDAILREHKGTLRTEVAQAVSRRKAPELQLRLVPPGFKS
ncbi:MAG: hypothetical protein KF752_11615 [Pirellulaceae bacterium]|nr:hypothetical protein [Pirellulaceae bacterium]